MRSKKNLEDLRAELNLIHKQFDNAIKVNFNKKSPKKEIKVSKAKLLKVELNKAMIEFKEKLRGDSKIRNLRVGR